MSKIETLAQKYKIHFIKGRRYYEYDITNPLPLLEETVPYLFKYKDIEICCLRWNKMTVDILSAIDKISPKTEEELLAISYDWTRAVVFSKTSKTNYSQYKNLYLHTNHTATHSMMNIQGLLKAYGIPLSDCFMLIRRHFSAEPEEVKEAIREDTIEKFSEMLKYRGKSAKDISTVIANFEIINKYLARVSPGYNDFFLFDDYTYFGSYKIKVLQYLEDERHYSSADRKYRIIITCLEYLDDYYKDKAFWDANAKNPIPCLAFEA